MGYIDFVNEVSIRIEPDKLILNQPLNATDRLYEQPDLSRVAKVLYKKLEKKLQASAIGLNVTAFYAHEHPDDFLSAAVGIGKDIRQRLHSAVLQMTYDWKSENEYTNITLGPAKDNTGKDGIAISSNFHWAGPAISKAGALSIFDSHQASIEKFQMIMQNLLFGENV